ncbi:MAG: ATP phosphoribosyltransferase [Gammaproteobacteria bacterium]|nr:ATP phosphoribosyltransferase [Gammaproteobacteria bacterium]
MQNNNRIRIAIQKSGRLNDESLRLMAGCGISIKPRKEQLFCQSDNFELDVLLVRDDDIPSLISEGICDFGIVGTNLLNEKVLQNNSNLKNKVEVIRTLNFAYCRLSIAVPKNFQYGNISSLKNCRIATSYPDLLKEFLEINKVKSEIINLSGSVEIAPKLGLADAICDLVSSGATLEANNLKEVETVLESQAVLIQSSKILSTEKQKIAEIFKNRVQGSQRACGSKYIMLHAPKSALESIVSLLPGVERPTILELQGDPNKVAIHALCSENIFWETMENLKSAGATSILVLPVEKMMA